MEIHFKLGSYVRIPEIEFDERFRRVHVAFGYVRCAVMILSGDREKGMIYRRKSRFFGGITEIPIRKRNADKYKWKFMNLHVL